MLPAQGSGTKTGLYLPADQTREYPWMQEGSPDPFALATATTTGLAPRMWLHDKIADKQAFEACLKSLSKGKAPGPDGITNEMLNLLPIQAQEMLHACIQLMWATAYTPKTWKESLTVLLYKNKGTTFQLQYYRRIGLENTIYKLWTRMITWTLADYAERHNIISYTQGGFRNKRTCTDQLELLTLILEDAKLTKKDMYLLMVDFSEAFDTIDHDKMLQIMYDLGFPTDALEVVKNLYMGATTAISTPFGPTVPISMDRGTIQGDSLSPFLFIVYLEPLLRWLRVGANGYVPGSFANLTAREQLKQQTPDITYADDLNLLADSVEKLCTQAQKVSLYADWGALRVNSTKTLLTGARYKSSPKDPYDGATLQRLLCNVRVQNAPATFHDPREPFKYLGVKFTMNLNWSAQFEATREALKQLTSSMLSSYATTTQKLRTINTCLRTKVRYAFCVAPYTNGQIQMLDSILCRAVKQAYGLPTCMSNAAVHEDVNRGGLGSPSLLTEYAMVQVQRLTAALNDTGPLGAISRARMQHEKCLLDKTTAAAHPALAQHSMRLRQQLACVRVNIELRKDQTEILSMDRVNPLIQEIVTISNHSTATANAVLEGIHTPDPPPLLILDLYHLRIASFRRLQDLMSNTGRGVLNIKQVELKTGKTLTGRAATAFRRVSYMLTLPPGATKDTYKSRPPAIKGHDCIHPEYARLLRGQHHIEDMDVRQATLPLLWSAQVQAASTEAAMDEIQEHIAKLINGRIPGQAKASSVRATASDITWPLTAAPLFGET